MEAMLGTIAMLFRAIVRAEGSQSDGLFAKLSEVKVGTATLTLDVMPKETRFVLEGDSEGLIDGDIVQFHIKDSQAVWAHHTMKVTKVVFEP